MVHFLQQAKQNSINRNRIEIQMNGIACTVCQQPGHRSNKCPELVKELEPGFFRPSGNAPQGGGGDDDEKLSNLWLQLRAQWFTLASSTQGFNAQLKTQKNC